MIEIKKLIRQVEKELSSADWNGDNELSDELRRKLDMLAYKLSIGETHEVDF